MTAALTPPMSALIEPGLAAELRKIGAFDAEACMNCGYCSATCPLGVDVLPRRLFRYVLFGMERQVKAESDNVFSCLLCRACEQSCPAGVHITENVRVLRGWLLREGF
jgi:heterodisulfide reductase subunit C